MEVVKTTCFTQKMAIVIKMYSKNAYELLKGRKQNIFFFHVIGCSCYILNQTDNMLKFEEKSDEVIFISYSSLSKAFHVYNLKRTTKEPIHVKFDE